VEMMQRGAVSARQHQPAIRLTWIDVFQEEEVYTRRLLFGFVAQTALAHGQRCGNRHIARTVDGKGRKCKEQ
jgi:hypothetical protein